MASTGKDYWAVDVKRRGRYKFGKQQVQFYKPSKGYPTEEQAARKPKKKLELEHVYGYCGNSRQCMIAKDGKIIYYLAATGIVYDVESNSQQFFLEHNDDITCICADPREGSTLVATGQKDPKDTPGGGKDLPKIYIWDMETMAKVTLIDRVCVALIRRVRWSPASGYLYVLCGDDGQSLKVYDTSGLKPGSKAGVKKCQTVLLDQPTTRQKIQGYVLNPKPKAPNVDEIVFFCTGKVMVANVTEGKGGKLALGKLTAITIKTKDKAYVDAVFFPSGRFVVAGASGGMYFCEGSKLDKEVKGAHKKSVKAFALNESGNTLYSAGMDRVLKSWDSRGKNKWTSEEIEVKDSDFTMTPQTLQMDEKTNSLYVGSKSNQILRYEMKTNESSVVIDGHDGQVWGLACHPKKPFFITGGWDRAVKVWDPKTWTCKRTHEFPKAKKSKGKDKDKGDKKEKEMEPERYRIQQCCTSPNGNWIAVGTADSTIVIVSYPKLTVMCTERIPKANANNELEGVEYLRFSPNGKMLAAAHGDGNAYVFTFSVSKDGDKKKVALKRWKPLKHRAAPSHLQWGEDNCVLKTLTRDYEVVHWVLEPKKKSSKMFAKIPDPDKYKFSGDPLIAGWDVQGLYQDGWDGTDMNDASMTSDGKLIATGDDFGMVRLHKFPAIDRSAHHGYNGHAEHVCGVEFLADDTYLLTAGGADMAIFQWKMCG